MSSPSKAYKGERDKDKEDKRSSLQTLIAITVSPQKKKIFPEEVLSGDDCYSTDESVGSKGCRNYGHKSPVSKLKTFMGFTSKSTESSD